MNAKMTLGMTAQYTKHQFSVKLCGVHMQAGQAGRCVNIIRKHNEAASMCPVCFQQPHQLD